MFDKIAKMIKEKKLKASDCEYHTLRINKDGSKVRCIVLKGEKIAHIEIICPNCKQYSYFTQEWKQVSKAAQYRFKCRCPKCNFLIKVEKLKGGKKKKETG